MTRHATPWQDLPADEAVAWTPTSPPQVIEGPLDLTMFRGRLLTLDLDPGQVALHVVDGRLRRVYLDGHQQLHLTDGPGSVAPEGWLVFLRTDASIGWRWSEPTRLQVDAGRAAADGLPLRGACAVRVSDPVRFHDSVLIGLDELPPPHLPQVLDTLIRSHLESRLHGLTQRDALDPVQAKVLLEDLEPTDLDDDLEPLGLACSHLAVAIPVAAETEADATDDTPVACYDDVL